MIKNGANGISVFIFIFFLDKKIKNKPIIVPSQNEITKENKPADNPSSHPNPRINLPSPNPINRPLEKYQSATNGIASTGPASKSVSDGKIKIAPAVATEEFIKIEIKESKIKR